ncbi:MAG: protein kinase, partial [Candidatus Omnitrophica bacterium]|nr:protein kinase [Candidatus Omnitrophota bacterium]
AHSVGIIHKDIKARNILISADIQGEPEAVLTDFGIGQIEDSNLLLAQGITATGVTRTSSTSSSQTGTRLYMAPELLEGKVGATTADIYSLGVLLYQVVCGDLSRALATGWERDVPDEFLREDIALCVDHLPEQRIQSANEISSRLRNLNKRHIQKEAEEQAAKEAERQRRRKKLFLTSSIAGILAIILIGAVAIREYKHREEEERNGYYSSIVAAAHLIEDQHIKRARELLADCPPAYRHWEWGRLQYLCNQDLMTLRGHEAQVAGIDFSPDGKLLASTDWRGNAFLWDAETGERKEQFLKEDGLFWDLKFSQDGKRIYVFYFPDNRNCSLIIWDIDERRRIRTLNFKSHVRGLDVSPDEKLVATANNDGKFTVWDIAKEKLIWLEQVKPADDILHEVTFSPDGRYLASGSKDNEVTIWDLNSQTAVHRLAGHFDTNLSLAFSPDSHYLASGDFDGRVILWDVETRKQIGEFFREGCLPAHKKGIWGLAFDSSGIRLATGSADNTAALWDVATRTEKQRFVGHCSHIMFVKFRPPEENCLATSSWDGTVKIWDTVPREIKESVFHHQGTVNSIEFSQDGSQLLTASGSELKGASPVASIWNIAEGTILSEFRGYQSRVKSAQFSPTEKTIVTVGGGKAIIWDISLASPIAELGDESNSIYCAVFDRDDNSIVTGGNGITRWDIRAGNEIGRATIESSVSCLAHNVERTLIAAGLDNGDLIILDYDSLEILKTLELNSKEIYAITFSRNSRFLMAGGESGILLFWDLKTNESKVLSTDKEEIYSLCITPDGKRLFAAGLDNSVSVWDIAEWREIVSLYHQESSVYSVAISPDGRTVASGDMEGRVLFSPSFPWSLEDYPGGESRDLQDRIETFKRKYWEEGGK